MAKDELDPAHHVLRHIKKSWMQDDFVEPMAFRIRRQDGGFEDGLSVNWMEYFDEAAPQDVVAELVKVFAAKGRKAGGESGFALLNVEDAKRAAAAYTAIRIVRDQKPLDKSHALVKDYEMVNDQVAEALAAVVKDLLPAKPPDVK